jgi:hypothetical protein
MYKVRVNRIISTKESHTLPEAFFHIYLEGTEMSLYGIWNMCHPSLRETGSEAFPCFLYVDVCPSISFLNFVSTFLKTRSLR